MITLYSKILKLLYNVKRSQFFTSICFYSCITNLLGCLLSIKNESEQKRTKETQKNVAERPKIILT